MKKIFVLLILFTLSVALKQFGLLEDAHQSVLLAIGLVILSAYTLSEIGSSLKLPRVTGYILTGLLLGPYALKVLSDTVVGEIKMFNTLAIGLIAVTAGLELHFSSLKKVILPILTTSFLKILFLGITSVAAIVVANEYVYDFGMGLTLPLFALALVFGALSLGTSPAISIAVISEMKAKSRMSQLVLGSAIVKDVLVVVTLAIVLSFAKSLSSPDVNTTESFIHLLEELGASLLAGCILGGIFIAYIRFIRQEMFLFIAAMILVTAEISSAIHLELLLVFIVAGIVVRNFAKDQDILHHALEKVSLPVFVVFFTNVGAGLNLQTTFEFLPIAGLFFGARALSYVGASYLAGRIHNESPSIQKKIWLGYLPQAGVTLGLIAIAAKGLPEYADLITNIGLGLVTLNLLLGPIFLRVVLKAEEPDVLKADESENIETDENATPEEIIARAQSEKEDFDLMIHNQSEVLDDEIMESHFAEVSVNFFEIFKKQQLLPQKNILNNFIDELDGIDRVSEQEIVARIDDHFKKMGEKGRDIYNAMSLYQKEIDRVLVAQPRPVPLTGIYWQSDDKIQTKLLKVLWRPYYFFNKKPERDVPLRKIAKFNLEPFIGSFTLQMVNSWYRLLGKHIVIFQKSLESQQFDSDEIIKQIAAENEAWILSVQADFTREYGRISKKWLKQLEQVNTVYLSDTQIRYSNVEPEIKEKFEAAKKASLLWEEKFVYCRNRLKVIVQSALLSKALENLLLDKFFAPINDAKTNADQLVQEVFEYFTGVETQLREQTSFDNGVYQALKDKTQKFADEHLQADIKTKYVRGSFRLLNRDISINLKRSLPKEAGSFQIASELTPAHQVKSASEILVKRINLYELFEQSILINFLPIIEEKIEGVSNYLESLIMEMEQAFSIITYSLESQIGGETELSQIELKESLLNSIATEKDKIQELHSGLSEYITTANESAEKLLEESQQEVKQGIERFSVVSTAKNQFRQRLYGLVNNVKARKHYLDQKIDGYYQRVKNLALQQSEREIDRALSKKIVAKTLDTTTVRQFINETYKINTEISDLPRVYYRLFSLDPIQDKRFFVAHQKRFRHFEPFGDEKGFTESQKILIIGDRGMGKSSLINVAQMDIKTDRLIRIESEDLNGPVKALAQALGCNVSTSSILNSLRKKTTTVIIDNVDQMLNKKKLQQFENLCDIIKQSPHQAHWILSITKFNLDSLDRAYKIRSLFNKLVDLNEVNLETCKEIILGRHRLSGLRIKYPKTFISDWAMRVGLSTEDEMFFRVLFERSHGHLRHLIYLWILSLKKSDGKSIELSMSKTIERGLPMIHEFSTLQKYLLNELYSYHHLSVQTLSDNLGVSYSIVDNETQYLEHCGLITTRGIDRSTFEIPNHLVQPIGFELKKEGILYDGFNQFGR